ncbi:MAG: lysoplasmalogenase [Clostridia bacterium]|nr:lysoplasmalogenase [Clostridia bacterium]
MWILLGCAVLSLGTCLPLFLHYKPLKLPLAACFKSLGTLCAMVPALTAALKLDPLYWIFVAAISLHAVADYLLEYVFEVGLGFFLLGHVCYIIAFLRLFPVGVPHLVLLVCFLAYLAYLFYRHRTLIGKNMLPFAVYGIILCVMAASGIAGGATNYGWSGLMVALGAALFFFSDNMVFRGLLFPNRPRYDVLIMVTYYLAQLLLGGSCLL